MAVMGRGVQCLGADLRGGYGVEEDVVDVPFFIGGVGAGDDDGVGVPLGLGAGDLPFLVWRWALVRGRNSFLGSTQSRVQEQCYQRKGLEVTV